MTLSEFRKLFVDITGRFDLVVDASNYADDGANFYIQAGQRFLDSKFKHTESLSVLGKTLEIGKEVYALSNLLSITNVQVSTPEFGWVTLGLLTNDEINELSLPEAVNSVPRKYAILNTMRNPFTEDTKTVYSKLSLRVYPAPDKAYEAEISGRISKVMKADDDTSFWSVNYPETLIRAAQYQIETFHRNTQGANDHLIAIERDLIELEHDEIESGIGQLNQMRDSFKFRGKGNAS